MSFSSLSVGGLLAGKIDIVWMSGDPGSDLPVCPAAEPSDEHWYAIRWHKRSSKCCAGMPIVCTAFRMIYRVLLCYSTVASNTREKTRDSSIKSGIAFGIVRF